MTTPHETEARYQAGLKHLVYSRCAEIVRELVEEHPGLTIAELLALLDAHAADYLDERNAWDAWNTSGGAGTKP